MQQAMYALADGVAVARRNIIKIKRVPEILFAVLITPLVFVTLFAYVFGGSIEIPGGSYRESSTGSARYRCRDLRWCSAGQPAM